MDIVLLIQAVILGIVEGLTEFLPVSSTGHLILAADLLGLGGSAKIKIFNIVIQAGAILAVCWEYRQRLISTFAGIASDAVAQRFTRNLAIAFLPAASLGYVFKDIIRGALWGPVPVALAFAVGGFIILFAERWYQRREKNGLHPRINSIDQLTPLDALKLGAAQCAALIPGTSRSGATIIGGMFFGLSRKCATEFSFFLAIPTLFAVTVYSLWKDRAMLSVADLPLFGVGSVTAFITAFVVVRWLIRYVSSHNFLVFAWYRIAFGLVIMATAYFGVVDWTKQ